LIGVNCLINILHNVSGDRTYANVQAISPLIKGMVKIAPRDYVRVQNRPADANGKAVASSDDPPPYTDEDLGGGPAWIEPEDAPF
jgi:hypothetical protein